MKCIDYDQLQACLFSRIPPSDFMAHNLQLILDENTQLRVKNDLEAIANTNSYYVKLFLARYVRVLEQKAAVIDELYELYCKPEILGAQELTPTSADILLYSIDNNKDFVAIKETPRVISGAGTTGLRTWEAALYLSNYLNNSPRFEGAFERKRILELGSGTGLVCLALMKRHGSHRFHSITLTDGDSALLEKLPETFALNSFSKDLDVNVSQLIWGEPLIPQEHHVDIVVAADVTYDASIVPQLCDTLAQLFDTGATVAYVAATIRNEQTIEAWEAQLNSRFSWNVCDRLADPHSSELNCWFRVGTPEVRVYEIKTK